MPDRCCFIIEKAIYASEVLLYKKKETASRKSLELFFVNYQVAHVTFHVK
jgi:hypothetical protein